MTARSLWALFMEGLGRREKRLSVHAGARGLSACRETPVAGEPPESVFIPYLQEGLSAAFLQKLWDERRWPRTGWTLSVPVKHAFFRLASVPASAPAEIRAVLSLQALRHMPLTPEEIVTDFVPLKIESKGLSEVLMAVLLSEELEPATAPFRAAGLAPGRLLPAPLSQAGLEKDGQDLTALLKAGDGAFLKEASAKPASDELLAAGALRWTGASPNFLPLPVRDEAAKAGKKRALLATATLASGLLLVLGGFAAQKNAALRARLEEVRDLRAGHAVQVRRLAAMERQAARFQADGERSDSLPALLKMLGDAIPRDVALENVSYDREKGVLIQGSAFSFARAVATVNALESSGGFSRVELKSSSAARLHDRDVVSFQIECLWPPRAGRTS